MQGATGRGEGSRVRGSRAGGVPARGPGHGRRPGRAPRPRCTARCCSRTRAASGRCRPRPRARTCWRRTWSPWSLPGRGTLWATWGCPVSSRPPGPPKPGPVPPGWRWGSLMNLSPPFPSTAVGILCAPGDAAAATDGAVPLRVMPEPGCRCISIKGKKAGRGRGLRFHQKPFSQMAGAAAASCAWGPTAGQR